MGGGVRTLTVAQAVFLGVVQGLTEFLPVSSSGHLALFRRLLGLPQAGLTFEVMVHLGTLVAVLVALREDWLPIVTGLFSPPGRRESLRKLGLLALATVPVGVVGLALKSLVEGAFASVAAVGGALLVTGAVLWGAERLAARAGTGKALDGIGPVDALLVGCAQAAAILPGVSRSGMTIGAALARGVERGAAARFAFLLSIPAILGATLVELPGLLEAGAAVGVPVLAGAATAALSGYVAIRFFLRFLRERSLRVFVYYTWAAGLLALLSHFLG